MQLLFRGGVCREFGEFPLQILCGDRAGGTILEARVALCVDCTNGGFAFLASQFPQLLSHM